MKRALAAAAGQYNYIYLLLPLLHGLFQEKNKKESNNIYVGVPTFHIVHYLNLFKYSVVKNP